MKNINLKSKKLNLKDVTKSQKDLGEKFAKVISKELVNSKKVNIENPDFIISMTFWHHFFVTLLNYNISKAYLYENLYFNKGLLNKNKRNEDMTFFTERLVQAALVTSKKTENKYNEFRFKNKTEKDIVFL